MSIQDNTGGIRVGGRTPIKIDVQPSGRISINGIVYKIDNLAIGKDQYIKNGKMQFGENKLLDKSQINAIQKLLEVTLEDLGKKKPETKYVNIRSAADSENKVFSHVKTDREEKKIEHSPEKCSELAEAFFSHKQVKKESPKEPEIGRVSKELKVDANINTEIALTKMEALQEEHPVGTLSDKVVETGLTTPLTQIVGAVFSEKVVQQAFPERAFIHKIVEGSLSRTEFENAVVSLGVCVKPTEFFEKGLEEIRERTPEEIGKFAEFALQWAGKNRVAKDYPAKALQNFAAFLKEKEETGLQSLGNRLESQLVENAKVQSQGDENRSVRSGPMRLSVLTSLKPSDLAHDLLALQLDLLNQIDSGDILNKVSGGEHKTGLDFSTTLMNNLVTFVEMQFIGATSVDEREKLLEFFLDVAENSRSRGDFTSVQFILAGLGKSSVFRLQPLNQITNAVDNDQIDQLEDPSQKKLAMKFGELKKIMSPSNNYKALKEAVQKREGDVCIYPINLIQTDLTFTKDGNPSVTVEGALNSKKMELATGILKGFEARKQYLPAQNSVVPRTNLSELIVAAGEVEGDTLYKISLILQPREEKVALSTLLPKASVQERVEYMSKSHQHEGAKAYFNRNKNQEDLLKKCIDSGLMDLWKVGAGVVLPADARSIRNAVRLEAYNQVQKLAGQKTLSSQDIFNIATNAIKVATRAGVEGGVQVEKKGGVKSLSLFSFLREKYNRIDIILRCIPKVPYAIKARLFPLARSFFNSNEGAGIYQDIKYKTDLYVAEICLGQGSEKLTQYRSLRQQLEHSPDDKELIGQLKTLEKGMPGFKKMREEMRLHNYREMEKLQDTGDFKVDEWNVQIPDGLEVLYKAAQARLALQESVGEKFVEKTNFASLSFTPESFEGMLMNLEILKLEADAGNQKSRKLFEVAKGSAIAEFRSLLLERLNLNGNFIGSGRLEDLLGADKMRRFKNLLPECVALLDQSRPLDAVKVDLQVDKTRLKPKDIQVRGGLKQEIVLNQERFLKAAIQHPDLSFQDKLALFVRVNELLQGKPTIAESIRNQALDTARKLYPNDPVMQNSVMEEIVLYNYLQHETSLTVQHAREELGLKDMSALPVIIDRVDIPEEIVVDLHFAELSDAFALKYQPYDHKVTPENYLEMRSALEELTALKKPTGLAFQADFESYEYDLESYLPQLRIVQIKELIAGGNKERVASVIHAFILEQSELDGDFLKNDMLVKILGEESVGKLRKLLPELTKFLDMHKLLGESE